MQKVLVHKSEAIPDLEEALAEATARYEEAKKARAQKFKLDELKKELAWSYVVSKEEVWALTRLFLSYSHAWISGNANSNGSI